MVYGNKPKTTIFVIRFPFVCNTQQWCVDIQPFNTNKTTSSSPAAMNIKSRRLKSSCSKMAFSNFYKLYLWNLLINECILRTPACSETHSHASLKSKPSRDWDSQSTRPRRDWDSQSTSHETEPRRRKSVSETTPRLRQSIHELRLRQSIHEPRDHAETQTVNPWDRAENEIVNPWAETDTINPRSTRPCWDSDNQSTSHKIALRLRESVHETAPRLRLWKMCLKAVSRWDNCLDDYTSLIKQY